MRWYCQTHRGSWSCGSLLLSVRRRAIHYFSPREEIPLFWTCAPWRYLRGHIIKLAANAGEEARQPRRDGRCSAVRCGSPYGLPLRAPRSARSDGNLAWLRLKWRQSALVDASVQQNPRKMATKPCLKCKVACCRKRQKFAVAANVIIDAKGHINHFCSYCGNFLADIANYF